ncbi:MAG: phosphohistidine phosphatase [Rhodothermaceae bacterium]|nr:MAG: histidine phosphatase family protein [Bacteroidota bacterium]GIV61456.1 MAG: phosphohistidine phosphatase [Rhodothermaceae bacterium]
MKTLLFFRHGKSDWDAAFDHDHERPLARRGQKAARKMGRFLAAIGSCPDYIVASSAVRARTTVELAADAGAWPACPRRVTDALYEAGPADLLAEIRKTPDTRHRLMLVGHEPTWSETISRFIGGGAVRFPTAAMARVDLDIDHWADAAFGDGELIWLVIPKALP